MSWQAAIALLTIPINLALGLYVLSRDPRRTLNRLFFVLTILLAIWGAGEVISLAALSTQAVLVGRKVAAVGWIMLAPVTVHFTLVLTRRLRILEKWWLVLLPYALFGTLVVLGLTTSLLFKSIVVGPYGYKLVSGPVRIGTQVATMLTILISAVGIIYYGRR
ncbi:MAG: hypothetical protein ACYC99_12460, partial [Candidatus Geothermincolia bacterium]